MSNQDQISSTMDTTEDRFSKRMSVLQHQSKARFSSETSGIDQMEKLASSMPNNAFLMGVKSDGLEATEIAKTNLLKNNKNIRIFENLNYQELAELVSFSDLGIIPYISITSNSNIL